MVMTRKPLFLQGPSASPVLHPAEDTRLNLGGLWVPDGADPVKVRSGILWGPGETAGAAPCTVTTPAASQVQVSRGRCVVQGSTTNSGAYVVTIDSAQTRTIAGASLPGSGQFKAGYVIVHLYDTVYGDAQDTWDVEVVLGVAAATAGAAVYPTVPNNALVLRSLTVDSAGNITLGGTPVYTALNGEPIPCTSLTRPASKYVGMRIFETDTFFERRWDGTYWEITSWRGSDRTAGGAYPQAGLSWPNAAIPNSTGVNYSGWPNSTFPNASMSTAGEGGLPLFSYDSAAGRGIVCNFKGWVLVQGYAASDYTSAGASFATILYNFANGGQNNAQGGYWGSSVDRRQRNSGYAGCGFIEQSIAVGPLPVKPGDCFGWAIYQSNAASGTVTYGSNFLTVAVVA